MMSVNISISLVVSPHDGSSSLWCRISGEKEIKALQHSLSVFLMQNTKKYITLNPYFLFITKNVNFNILKSTKIEENSLTKK